MNYTKANNISADMAFESVVTDYMMDNFWSKINTAQRVTDRRLQFAGADVMLSSDIAVDMKIKNSSQLTCEIPFPYPSVELMQTNIAGKLQTGWFADPKCITKLYAYLTVHAKHNDKRKLKQSDIIKVNMMLFSKKELTRLIEQSNSIRQLLEDSLTLNKQHDKITYYDDKHNKVFHLKLSNLENSVCLVMSRDKYLNLRGTKCFDIYPNRIVKY